MPTFNNTNTELVPEMELKDLPVEKETLPIRAVPLTQLSQLIMYFSYSANQTDSPRNFYEQIRIIKNRLYIWSPITGTWRYFNFL